MKRTVLSLGAGVQSSTLALLVKHGELPPIDAAIFADVKAEPAAVYSWLDWLTPQLPFPVYRVTKGEGLLKNVVQPLALGRKASIPAFTESASGGGQLRRQCTSEYKIEPIIQALRHDILGLARGQRVPVGVEVEQWIGISLDEWMRMKPSRERWITNRWPLVELEMTRADCLVWLERHGYPRPPKSSCTFCPYHDAQAWHDMKATDPAAWEQAVAVDRLIRAGVRGTKERLYLHRSLRPLDEVDFRTEQERGQLDLFGAECEGMCGL